jgi:hypothetical protein
VTTQTPSTTTCIPKWKLYDVRKEYEGQGGLLDMAAVMCDTEDYADAPLYESARCAYYTTDQVKDRIASGEIELGCSRKARKDGHHMVGERVRRKRFLMGTPKPSGKKEDEQACVLDNNDCYHTFCEEPLGWCQPLHDDNDGLQWQEEELGDLNLMSMMM